MLLRIAGKVCQEEFCQQVEAKKREVSVCHLSANDTIQAAQPMQVPPNA